MESHEKSLAVGLASMTLDFPKLESEEEDALKSTDLELESEEEEEEEEDEDEKVEQEEDSLDQDSLTLASRAKQSWAQWADCRFTADFTAQEFLKHWKRKYHEVQMYNGAGIAERYLCLQFLRAVNAHPEMTRWNPEPHSLDLLHKDFVSIAKDVKSRKHTFLFVARSSSGNREANDKRLELSLEWTRSAYERHYDVIDSRCELYTFTKSSNEPLTRTGEVASYFRSLLKEVDQYDGKLILVINGWDGLTTNETSFLLLFSDWGERVTFRVYSEESPGMIRRFFEVNVRQVCEVFRGERDFQFDENSGDFDGSSLEGSTGLYIRNFYVIRAINLGFSELSKKLSEVSCRRNNHPDQADLSNWKCKECETALPTCYSLNRHMHHRHNDTLNIEKDLTCQYCGKTFIRKDHRDRHERTTCVDNPLLPSKETEEGVKKKRAKRGSKLRHPLADSPLQPQGSDNGILPYLRLGEDYAVALPRLQLDPENPQDGDGVVIYKGELYCRWPGCTNSHRFSEPGKLTTHYRRKHNFSYQRSSVGTLNPADQQLHNNGLEWLARCVQLGEEKAGAMPRPIRK